MLQSVSKIPKMRNLLQVWNDRGIKIQRKQLTILKLFTIQVFKLIVTIETVKMFYESFMCVSEKWWTSLKMLFLLDRHFLLSISCRKRFNYHVDGCSLVRNGCRRELSLGKNVDFAGRTADIQYATGWIRRDLTSSLVLGLSYRLFIWAALFLVISRLKSSHNYLTTFQSRYYHYRTIKKKVIFKFIPLYLIFIPLYLLSFDFQLLILYLFHYLFLLSFITIIWMYIP